MKIELVLKEKDVVLVLRSDDRDVERVQWEDHNDLLEKFFPVLDDLLVRHVLVIEDIDDFSLVTNIPKGYTTERIARTIIKTLRFARKS